MIRYRTAVFVKMLLIVLCCTTCAGKASSEDIRPPAVAGSFYPSDAEVLTRSVDAFLAEAPRLSGPAPIAIVAPHAGYVFSGRVAAAAFQQAAREPRDVVVILAPNHTLPFDRVGLSPASAFRTPLGAVAIDRELNAALLRDDRDCAESAAVHAREHAIEVQLPFIQRLFPEAKIVPIVVGLSSDDALRRLGQTIAKAVSGRRALIVASSDLSHYPSAKDAERVDRETLQAAASLDVARFQKTIQTVMRRGIARLDTAACGEAPIQVAMIAAQALGANRGTVVQYAHSGQSAAGEQARVVGYGAVTFTRDSAAIGLPAATATPTPRGALAAVMRQALLAIARRAIEQSLTGAPASVSAIPPVLTDRGLFVTLKKKGDLRGCIGQILPGPVPALVREMALKAAFHDPRFPPLQKSELREITIEISLLTVPQVVARPEEVVVGRDGVLLRQQDRGAVFLPQVAPEQGWDRATMLDHLCLKAGLDIGCWRQGATLLTFQAEIFGEDEHTRSGGSAR